ncbi:rho-related GTP-binding protein RhoC-like [Cylas formicarius]|uniref:rho-related GTP-binding protein RhoC-like n=1 Tax=Cylas formicarius TaxID=197179 RepID=UPI002958C7D0|nr:rho-related GTP-binding protein RhoC-like [Cylas formicarius]
MDHTKTKKIVVVGDGACGKTCLLTVFATNEFPEDYIPTIFETYLKEIEIDGQKIRLALWDTAGEEDYDRLRPLSYPRTDLVIICFGLDNRTSLENVKSKWYPEIKHFLPGVPYILVGNKLDLRRGSQTPTYRDGLKVRRRIKAQGYFECSSMCSLGVRDIFEQSARICLNPKKKTSYRSCLIL